MPTTEMIEQLSHRAVEQNDFDTIMLIWSVTEDETLIGEPHLTQNDYDDLHTLTLFGF